jgi:hypothetical protein
MNLINYLARHWQRSPVFTVYTPPGVETDEVVTTLIVARWAGGDGTNGACLHAVVMFLVGLDVFTKFNFAMGIEVKLAVED